MIQSVDKSRETLDECARLKQAILSFTGILKQSSDPSVREAAHALYKQVKSKP